MKIHEADLIRTALERGGSVGPSAAETMRLGNELLAKVSEKEFMGSVIALAKEYGWHVYHVYFSQNSEPGFPDLVLVRERVIFAELKKETGKQTKVQFAWEGWLLDADAEVYCWRPSSWPEIVKVLA